LVVKDGLNLFSDACSKIQHACGYIFRAHKQSRIREFAQQCASANIPFRKVPKDVCTRWNSTYEMLKVAYDYRVPIQKVFNMHNAHPVDQIVDSDWDEIRELTKFLENFYYATKQFSGIYYPTVIQILWYICGISVVFVKYKKIQLMHRPLKK